VANKDLGIAEADDFLRRGLDELLDLESDQLAKLGLLLSNPDSGVPEASSELKRLSDETGLDSQVLYRILPVIRYLLFAWRKARFSLPEVLVDLRKAGIEDEKVERSKLLLEPLEAVREMYFAHSLKNRLELVGGPTIDDLSLVWDVRPIFSSSAYPPDRGEEDGAEWIGHTYVLSLEISASRRDGQQESTSLQLSEQDFDQFERAMARARQQLVVLKGKVFS
jgi:hypothetical protein